MQTSKQMETMRAGAGNVGNVISKDIGVKDHSIKDELANSIDYAQKLLYAYQDILCEIREVHKIWTLRLKKGEKTKEKLPLEHHEIIDMLINQAQGHVDTAVTNEEIQKGKIKALKEQLSSLEDSYRALTMGKPLSLLERVTIMTASHDGVNIDSKVETNAGNNIIGDRKLQEALETGKALVELKNIDTDWDEK